MRRKWTPGPWKQVAGHVYRAGKGRDGANIASVSEPRASTHVGYTELSIGGKDADEAFANAHLIAAAPELYEALDALSQHFERVVKAFHIDSDKHETLLMARAALAKARGE